MVKAVCELVLQQPSDQPAEMTQGAQTLADLIGKTIKSRCSMLHCSFLFKQNKTNFPIACFSKTQSNSFQMNLAEHLLFVYSPAIPPTNSSNIYSPTAIPPLNSSKYLFSDPTHARHCPEPWGQRYLSLWALSQLSNPRSISDTAAFTAALGR